MIPHATTAQDPPNVWEWLHKMKEKGYSPETGWYPDSFEGNLYYKKNLNRIFKDGEVYKKIKVFDDKVTFCTTGPYKEMYSTPLETKEKN